MSISLTTLTVLSASWLTVMSGAAMQDQPAAPAQTQPTSDGTVTGATATIVVKPAIDDPASILTAEDMLDVLERANQDLVTLRANIRIGTLKDLQGDLQRRTGVVHYESRKPAPEEAVMPVRRFAVKFTELDNDGVVSAENQTFVFTGRDLIERNDNQKFYSRRCVVKEGDTRDPMRIGEGPVPLPIGQKKADILQRFEVELWEPTRDLVWHVDGEQKDAEKFVDGSKQLRLLPKPEANLQGDIVEIRLWYRPNKAGEWLPRLAWTKNKAGDTTFVELKGVSTNGEIDPAVMNVEKPAGNAWVVQEVDC